jgi:hypothetical protein
MTGGLIQLVAYGHEDLFLTRDPQITFFKVIYRRHTNFALEDIQQRFIHEPEFGKRASCLISQDADMINRMALKITLPEIPKFATNTNANDENKKTKSPRGFCHDNNSMKVAWIRRIGFAMIKNVEIEINGKIIDRHYGEWMHIWSVLTTRNIDDDGLNKLIGNVPELTLFTEFKKEYILYVPLYFWFCRASGLSLPLIALQFCDIKINVEFFELEKCLLFSPTHYIKCDANLVNFQPFEYLHQKGPDNIERYGIFSHYDIINKRLYYTSINCDKLTGIPYEGGDVCLLDETIKSSLLNTTKACNYLIKGFSSDFSVKPDVGVESITLHKHSLKNIKLKECVMLVDYVFLDTDERMKFAQTKHDYLIEQLYFTPNVLIEGNHPKVKLDIDQPCKLTVWLAQLDYICEFNDRFNYTDSHILKRPYDTFDFEDDDCSKFKEDCDFNFKNIKVGEEIGKGLIDEEEIRLNSQVRLSKRTNEYFEYIQPFQTATNSLPRGVAMYSYALIPTEVVPSGTTNMSQIELIELLLKMNHKIAVNHRAKFRSYSLCYNVWRVDNGLSARIFIR